MARKDNPLHKEARRLLVAWFNYRVDRRINSVPDIKSLGASPPPPQRRRKEKDLRNPAYQSATTRRPVLDENGQQIMTGHNNDVPLLETVPIDCSPHFADGVESARTRPDGRGGYPGGKAIGSIEIVPRQDVLDRKAAVSKSLVVGRHYADQHPQDTPDGERDVYFISRFMQQVHMVSEDYFVAGEYEGGRYSIGAMTSHSGLSERRCEQLRAVVVGLVAVELAAPNPAHIHRELGAPSGALQAG